MSANYTTQCCAKMPIETNIALLREWGWGTTSLSSWPSSPVRPGSSNSSPIKNRLVSFLSPSPSTSRESPKISLKQFKSSVEHVIIKWINTEVANSQHIKVYFRVRKEFVEYRSIFNTIMVSRNSFTVEELAEIEKKWDSIRCQLDAATSRAESQLPEPYSSLSKWTINGQLIITTPLNLTTDEPKKCVTTLQKMISEHNSHFVNLTAKQEELRKVMKTGGVAGHSLAAEYVEPIRIRLNTLAEEAPLKLASLKILLSHYTVLAYIDDLEQNMDLWRSADSLSLLNRWIKEYNQVVGENPRARCTQYIEHLKKIIATSPPTKLEGKNLIQVCWKKTETTLNKFDQLKSELLNLRVLWKAWEEEMWKMEELAQKGIESNTRTIEGQFTALRTINQNNGILQITIKRYLIGGF
uniref:DHC_N1 domain-containing protein n=1 Tax=Heterorhabditis bacteriophora TaxID=37862 RepID=A0A1I7WTZ7_HETBA